MLLIALALHGATMAGKGHAAEFSRPRVIRATLKRSARPHPERSALITPCDVDRDCRTRATRNRFRVAGEQASLVDRKLEMLQAAQGPSCNRTGMPVCPGSGQQLLKLSY